jgi:hypothetical protein
MMREAMATAGEADYSRAASILIFADSGGARRRAEHAAQAAGARAIFGGGPEEGPSRIADHAFADAVLVELDGTVEDAAGPLFDALVRAATKRDQAGIVAVPGALLDLAAARAWHPRIRLLVDGDAGERVRMVGELSGRRPLLLSDVTRDDAPALLRQLAEDAQRLSSALAGLAEDQAQRAPVSPGEMDGPLDVAYVRAILRARRLRSKLVADDLFADPAWDMMLDLLAARLEGKRVPVSSLCVAAAVPSTTALRWIRLLTDRGLFERVADPADGRRVYIQLAEGTASRLEHCLRQAQRIACQPI